MTTSDDVFAFVGSFIRIPEGRNSGKPLVLREWQREIIRQIYDQPTRRALISVGRKNGKTTLTAILMLAHLAGPRAVPNSSIYSAAQSRDQAALVFNLAAKMVRMSSKLNLLIVIRESRKELFCGRTGVTYRALSADASTAYGLSPALVVHDELGQVKGPKSELYDALETAMSAHENPLSIVISTQAPSDGDLLSILIDDALNDYDEETRLFLHTAPMDADPWELSTIRLANPGLGDFLNEKEVLALAEDAKRIPSKEAAFRNLVLNQRVDRNTPFLTKSVWMACADPPAPLAGPIYAGLDLGAVQDLCAYVSMSKGDGAVWDIHPKFWLPEENLEAKGRQDHFDYVTSAKQGLVTPCPGRTVDWAMVADFLASEFRVRDIRKIGFDRWRFAELRPHLVRAGLSDGEIAEKFVEVGQGFQSMSRALDALERAVLDHRVRHGSNRVLNWNIANTMIEMDAAGNRKASKSKAFGRIDGLIALAMAFFVAPLEVKPPEYQLLFLGNDYDAELPVS